MFGPTSTLDIGAFTGTPDGLPDLPPLRTREKAGVGEHLFSRAIATGGGMYGTSGGWTGRRLEMVRHFRLWTRIAIHKLCGEIRRHPPLVGWVTERDPRQTQHHGYPGFHKSFTAEYCYAKSLNAIKPHEEIQQAPSDHPLLRLFNRPNEWDTGGVGEVLYELWMMLELTGVGYLWAVPDPRTGMPYELFVIPSHWVHTRINQQGIWYYQIIPVIGQGTWMLPADEVIYFRYKSPIHKIDGWSPLAAASEWTDLQDSMNFAQYSMMKNGAFPLGAVELPEKYDDPNDPALERMMAKFASRYQGEGRFGLPIFLSAGAKYTQLNISPAEMMFIESNAAVRDQILSNHDVPKEMVGISTAGTEVAAWGPLFIFYYSGVNPRLMYTATVLTQCLARRWDESLRVWWPDNTPPNPQQRVADIQAQKACNAISPDEVRAEFGREPLPDGLGELPYANPSEAPLGEAAQQDDVGLGGLFGGDEEETPQRPPERESEEEGDEGESGRRPEVTRALVAVASANGHADAPPGGFLDALLDGWTPPE